MNKLILLLIGCAGLAGCVTEHYEPYWYDAPEFQKQIDTLYAYPSHK